MNDKLEMDTMPPDEIRRLTGVALGNPDIPVLYLGPPGVGKTQVGCAVARDMGAKPMIWAPSVKRPEDVRGLGVKVTDGDTGEVRAEFVPFGDLHRMLTATEEMVVILDDFHLAVPAVQGPFFQMLIPPREINGRPIPPNVRFIATANRRQDQSGSQGILDAVASRFAWKFRFEENDPDGFRKFLLEEVPDDECDVGLLVAFTSFVESENEPVFKHEPNRDCEASCMPRSLHQLGVMKRMCDRAESDLPLPVVRGAIGQRMGAKFHNFMVLMNDLPDFEDILRDPEAVPVPGRNDARFAAVSFLLNRVDEDNVGAVVDYLGRFGDDFNQLFLSVVSRAYGDAKGARGRDERNARLSRVAQTRPVARLISRYKTGIANVEEVR